MTPRFRPSLGLTELLMAICPMGDAVEYFEKEFAATFGCSEGVAFGYGRTAMAAFFEAVGLKGTEIIMPAYTCSVVAHAITLSGNVPHFVDIDPDTFNMRLDQVAAAISEKTGAIVATHLFGHPLNLDAFELIIAAAESRLGRKIWVIQDCAHSFGATFSGRMVTTARDGAIFGLNISKLMTSIFGGMFTTNDCELAARVRTWRDSHLRPAGCSKSLKRLAYLLAVYGAFSRLGYNLTYWLQNHTRLLSGLTDAYHLDEQVAFPPDAWEPMTSLEARIGIAQLRKYPRIVSRRRATAARHRSDLPRRHPDWKLPPSDDGSTFSHFTVRVPDRAAARAESAAHGVELGELIQYSVAHLPAYKDCPGAARCLESLAASRNTVNLPLS